MPGPIAPHIEGLEGELHIVDGARRRGQMKNTIESAVDRDTFTEVGLNEGKGGPFDEVGHIRRTAGHHIVEGYDVMARIEEPLAKVRA
jgi:hypothetical protein